MYQLDSIDQQIVSMLIRNSRTSYADISKAVGLKSPSVIDRIKKLEQEGVIRAYTTRIDYRKLGYDISAFIGVSIDNTDHIDEFESHIKLIETDIIECHHVTGDFTMLMKVVTKNTESLSRLIKQVRKLPGVQKTNTILVFSTLMEQTRPV